MHTGLSVPELSKDIHPWLSSPTSSSPLNLSCSFKTQIQSSQEFCHAPLSCPAPQELILRGRKAVYLCGLPLRCMIVLGLGQSTCALPEEAATF